MKEAVKLALEAMRSYQGDRLESGGEINLEEEIKALEEALAKQEQGEPYECVCGANLYIDANGVPRSKASIEPATVMFKQEQGEPVERKESSADSWDGDADMYESTQAYNECAAAIRARGEA